MNKFCRVSKIFETLSLDENRYFSVENAPNGPKIYTNAPANMFFRITRQNFDLGLHNIFMGSQSRNGGHILAKSVKNSQKSAPVATLRPHKNVLEA